MLSSQRLWPSSWSCAVGFMAPPSMERGFGRVVPVSDALDQLVGLRGSPGAGLVLMHEGRLIENRIDDAPGFPDNVFAGEQGGVAARGVAEQTLVGLHVVARGIVAGDQLDVVGLPAHPAGGLDARPETDHHLGAQAEAIVIALLGVDVEERRRAVQ